MLLPGSPEQPQARVQQLLERVVVDLSMAYFDITLALIYSAQMFGLLRTSQIAEALLFMRIEVQKRSHKIDSL